MVSHVSHPSNYPLPKPTKGRPTRFAGYGLQMGSGRTRVVPASEHQEILVAVASLIRAQRYDMALTILDKELGGGC
jgi:hypothetical protein